jgi:DNA polymerase III sliding clamp (beta) subunit (PCNA family)
MITVNKAEFKRVITDLKSVAFDKSISIFVNPGELKLLTGNVDMSMTAVIPAVTTPTSKGVSARAEIKTLLEVLKSCGPTVTMEVINETCIKIDGAFTINLPDNCESYVNMYPVRDNDTILEFSASNSDLNKVAHSIDHPSSTRYFLQGVLVHADLGRLKLVSTDGHVLSHASLGDINSQDYKGIVPREVILKCVKSKCDVNFKMNKTQAFVEFKNYKITCKLIDGTFPDYKRALPRDEVIGELILTKSDVSQIPDGMLKFEFSELKTIVSSGTFKKNFKFEYKGSELTVGINSKYLKNVVTVSGDMLKFSLIGKSTAIKVTDGEDYYLIMPYRI